MVFFLSILYVYVMVLFLVNVLRMIGVFVKFVLILNLFNWVSYLSCLSVFLICWGVLSKLNFRVRVYVVWELEDSLLLYVMYCLIKNFLRILYCCLYWFFFFILLMVLVSFEVILVIWMRYMLVIRIELVFLVVVLLGGVVGVWECLLE